MGAQHRLSAALLIGLGFWVGLASCRKPGGPRESQPQRLPKGAAASLPETAVGEIDLVRSTALIPAPEDAVSVGITRRHLSVQREEIVDLPLEPRQERRRETGLQIQPLLEKLREIVEEEKRKGDLLDEATPIRVSVTTDQSLPYLTLAAAMYTAGEAGLSNFTLLVADSKGESARGINLVAPQVGLRPGATNVRFLGHLGHYYVNRRPRPQKKTGLDEHRRNNDALDSTIQKEPPTNANLADGPYSAAEVCRKYVGTEPLELTVAVNPRGFQVAAEGRVLSPQEGCSRSGPSICLRDGDVDVEEMLGEMRHLFDANESKKHSRARRLLNEIEGAYNWAALHNQLVELKRKFPRRTVIRIAASPEIPVRLVVRTMDVSRFRLNEARYEDSEAFQRALWQEPVPRTAEGNMLVQPALFSDPLLSIAL